MKLLAPHRNGKRYWKSSALALAATGVLLSLGLQDSCNTTSNVGLVPDTYDDAASPPINEEFSDVSLRPIGFCSDNYIMADTWCEQVCCSEYGSKVNVTRRHCSQVGGEEIPCTPN